jgi:energy-coupling factor transporter ATP-binding protein EcfA2
VVNYSKEVLVLEDGKLIAKLPTYEFLKNKELQKRAAYRF